MERPKAVQSAENNSASTLPTAQIQKRRLGLTSGSSSRWGDILDPWDIDACSYEDKLNISNKFSATVLIVIIILTSVTAQVISFLLNCCGKTHCMYN